MQITVKAAVIGPQQLVNRVLEEGSNFSEITLLSLPYTNEGEAAGLAQAIDSQVDVILFTGPVPYRIAKDAKDSWNASLLHINYGGSGLYRVLFQMFRDKPAADHFAKVSVDFLHPDEVEEAVVELDINNLDFFFLEPDPGYSSELIVQNHLKQWKAGRVNAAITCIYSVFERLRQMDVPAYCVLPTRAAIKSALKTAFEIGRSKTFEHNQIAACLVHAETINNSDKTFKLLSDALLTSGQPLPDGTILFYTTKALIFSLTEGYRKMPDIFASHEELALGIGIGRTATEAKVRAQAALLKNRHENVKHLYIIGDSNLVLQIKRIRTAGRLEYNSRSFDDTLRKVAEESGLSIATLSKLQYITRVMDTDVITAAELSSQLNITLRSARRIMKTLIDVGFAKVVGEEQPITRGRPRQVYKLFLP